MLFLSRWALLLAAFACATSAAHADESFNPSPRVLEGPAGAEARLTDASNGKTPTAKEFKPNWIQTLADRGEPTILTKQNSNNFSYIGMPIGGIGAGEIYLAGDGRLWNWDIFNTKVSAGFPVEQGLAYVKPHEVNNASDPEQIVVDQGFVLRTVSGGKTTTHTLDRNGFADIQFSGQYPIGTVKYSAADCPLKVELEAFSPFVPGVVEDSTYPATVLNYTLSNNSTSPVTFELAGWMENAVGLKAGLPFDIDHQNSVVSGSSSVTLSCAAAEAPSTRAKQPDKVFEDFESGTYDNWKVDGQVFGTHPDNGSVVPGGKPPKGFSGKFLVNSFAAKDGDAKGKLTSKDFVIDHSFITFLIAGGNYPGEECVNLMVDNKIAESATGIGGGNLKPVYWKVENLIGKTAHLEIVDAYSHAAKWPHILVDQIVFRDALDELGTFADQPDIGTMALTLLGNPKQIIGSAQLAPGTVSDAAMNLAANANAHATDKLVGGLKCSETLAPGEKKSITFLVTWCFPRSLPLGLKTPTGRQYGTRFKTAGEVVDGLMSQLLRLSQQTRLWHDTYYDSTLPYWFLDRTFLNVSTLATGTAYLLSDGRFYGYEGCYSCPGTCTHVWGYQQALGFLFPALEKSVLEKVEFNPSIGMGANGGVAMRGEYDKTTPVDGQAGIIMRSYLLHRMSANDTFLKTNFKSIKQAMDYLVKNYDANHTGILRGNQHNTMDAGWYGEVAWLSLYYQSALLATAQMADLVGDHDYAVTLHGIASHGRDYIDHNLFNGEYYFQKADPDHLASPGTYIGCHIDQLMGQNWADETGLGQILDPAQEKTALNSIWKYNYTTDAGLYRKTFTKGRNYTRPGDGAVVICTFPQGGEEALKKGFADFSAYMNESWGGCEHELAAVMMWQGLVDKSLAIVRTVNDRYAADKRNPWDECECGSHYSRSLSSYGVFTAACGFEYDGPAGYLAFSPRVNPANFKAAFTSAQSWGSFAQEYAQGGLDASVSLKFGKLSLKSLALTLPEGCKASSVAMSVRGQDLKTTHELSGSRLLLHFDELHLAADETLSVKIR